MPQQKIIPRTGPTGATIAGLKEDLERLDRELEDFSKRRLPPGRGLSPRMLRLPNWRDLLPLPSVGGLLLQIADPGYRNDTGIGPCFVATCGVSFIGGTQRNTCVPFVPFCFTALPVPPAVPVHANRADAIAADGVTLTHWGEYWVLTGGLTYAVGQIVGPLAVGDNIGKNIPVPRFLPTETIEGAQIVDPNAFRARQPDPKPETDPARDPLKDPREREDPEYLPRREHPWRRTYTIPVASPGRRVGPKPKPSPDPRGEPIPAPAPRPARKGEKEQKTQFSSARLYRVIMGIIDTVTETQDFVRAIHGALPRSIRCGRVRRNRYDTPGQALDIYKNFESLDVETALLNVVANQFEDAVIGRTQQSLLKLAGGSGNWASYSRYKNVQMAMKDAQKSISAWKKQMGLSEGCR